MALQFIFGGAGAGKSYYLYNKIIQQSIENPKKQYLILVPEQFTMQTQKELVTMHPRKGICNIDVLSFERLAFRVLTEMGESQRTLLEETGKSMVLRRVAQEKKKELKILGAKMDKQGYVSQMKSMVSELRQYEISTEDLEDVLEDLSSSPELYYKLQDIKTLYQGFFDYLEGSFITQEEVLDAMGRVAPQSKKLKDSVLVLDGYTGFTPIQLQLLETLLEICEEVYVTVTVAAGEDPYKMGSPHELFYLSRQTVASLLRIAKDKKISWKEYWIPEGRGEYQGRFKDNPPMAFLEKNVFRYRRKKYPKQQDAVQIYEAQNPASEMEMTAGEIRRLVRTKGYRYRDFAVITGDMQVYAPAAARAFARYEIPCFIDEKHSVFLNPFVEYLRAAVDMIVENFSYESIFRMLRCGLNDISTEEADRLENYVIAMGIRGFSRWQQEWVRSYRGENPEECVQIDKIRASLVEKWEPFYKKMKTPDASVRTYTEALYQYITANKIQEKLKEFTRNFEAEGNLSLVKEYSQIYEIVMNLLDKLVEILGDKKVRIREFKEILEAGLSEAKVGIIPPTSDQVLVGDMERTRLKDIKIVFFVGVNEGKIPKEQQAGKLLSDLNREELKGSLKERGLSLAPTAKENLYTQKFYLYLNLTKPSERIYLSYSRLSSSGEAMSPSFLVAQIQKLFPDAVREWDVPLFAESKYGALDRLSEEMRKQDRTSPVFEELMSWFTSQKEYGELVNRLIDAAYYVNPQESISKGVAEALYGTELSNSASRLEQFAKCACSHFLSYGLMLRERVRYEFSMADMGTLLHNSLDLFARKVREQGKSWVDLEDEERDTLAEDCVTEVVEKSGETILLSSARNAYTINRVKRMVKRSVWALQKQLKQGEFYPALTEWAFGEKDNIDSLNFDLESGQKLHLKGRIDRIDVCQDKENHLYVKVIDYKSGTTQLDLIKLYYGLQIQLALYLNAALELEKKRFPDKFVQPAGVFYYNTKDPILNKEDVKNPENPQEEILKKLKMDGICSSEPEILQKLDRNLSAGKSVESFAVPVKYTAKGTFSGNSKVANQEEFAIMMDYVQDKAKKIGREILKGNTSVNPFEWKKENACEYCPYKEICGFDEKLPGYEYRKLEKDKSSNLWCLMEEEMERGEK
ncbi:helicase-exonuclease AddAB subunit AddB [Blautia hansenii]|uniref:ATP-dependent nuclease subunit B n=1 Tax=Blautia hansenii DSM 20583 TaxID=537007 RepID=C9LAG6_BLAHA|nr:helicase-exonuclease AddAB subunit AddB [Blautia hansenii]ASM70331.1 helicase-exonuclease AddAB subunit AddB [Blautia hansenii DSM 20583]EEX20964.1 ATP-dependent nuclease subunit B [Blautia hansenii DSM 20583]UWO10180.1 helicase-exonuclease AddAB subunit AddB [Blautia hansenii DSM 20583]